jgi:hypothetical protein
MAEDFQHTPPALIPDADDGLDNYGLSERGDGLIKGRGQVKYDTVVFPGKWSIGQELIADDREFIVVKILKIVQKWPPDLTRPSHQIIPSNKPFPDIKTMNEAAPREEWRESFGQMKGPYEAAFVVYLLDECNMDVLTYIASTDGGRRAVEELRDRVSIARRFHGPVAPVVKLSNTFMPTQYGGRQRPDLEVVRFTEIAEQVAPRQIEHVEPEAIDTEPVEVPVEKPQIKRAAPVKKATVSAPSASARKALNKAKANLKAAS